MNRYSSEQLAAVVALPTVTIVLVWTVTIFHKNRKKWGPYDIPIVSVLALSIIRNIAILVYMLVTTLCYESGFTLEYCRVIVWLFNSIHTFQASALTTIAVIGLFSVILHDKQQSLKMFLTSTHVVYHLFCLTTLCACVGVAAVLAETDGRPVSNCRFMPFDLDIKFNAFVVVLHLFLAAISFVCFILMCYNFYRMKKSGCDYIKKSTSDLSDVSLSLNSVDNNKNFYDTYTIIRRGQNHYYDPNHHGQTHFQNGFCAARDINWNSDTSNLSATVSSTNSRRPCLGKRKREAADPTRTGLETMHPVLIVCYLFYHLPLIVLCVYPKLIQPWSVAGIALWLGLVQDILIPTGLGIVDSRFSKWVSNVYRCSGKKAEEKLPHVGLDGKFRPFGTSQPQSLETFGSDRSARGYQTAEHRFPITNGSLYTSIDGRLPVIHNYRRNKDHRGGTKQSENQSSNVALHSSHLVRQDLLQDSQKFPSCSNCEADLCPSHSNLHHLSPRYINRQLNLFPHNILIAKSVLVTSNRISQSHESLNGQHQILCRNSDLHLNQHIVKNSRNLARLNRMRLSKSEDSLNELQVNKNLGSTFQNVLCLEKTKSKDFTMEEVNIQNGYSSSDEDYITDTNEVGTAIANDNFDSISSKSCYSITTEANCDFEFFQNNKRVPADVPRSNTSDGITSGDNFLIMPSFKSSDDLTAQQETCKISESYINKNFRITRSNSKRSLESFQAYIEVEREDAKNNNSLHRSNSYRQNEHKKLVRSESKLSDCSHQLNTILQKINSVEYLPNSSASTIYFKDLNRYNCYYSNRNIGSSVPDLKKIFISEYI